jgi:rhodanese-related sulfurtransferase
VELGALGADPSRAPDGPLLVHCGHGERALTGASLLARAGRTDVRVLRGGPDELRAAGVGTKVSG